MFYNIKNQIKINKTNICNKILLVGISLALTGCVTLLDIYSNNKDMKAYSLEKYVSEKKGGVILSFSQKGDARPVAFTCKRLGSEQVYARGYSIGGKDVSFVFLTLDPGVYYIDSIHLFDSASYSGRLYVPHYKVLADGISEIPSENAKKALVKYGAFMVNPSRVSYLGTIEIDTKSNQGGYGSYNINYDLPKIKTDLEKAEVQHLFDLIDTQSMFKSGSVIVERNGKSDIVSAEEINQRYQKQKK